MLGAGHRFWAPTGHSEDGQVEGHFFLVLINPTGPDRLTLIAPYCTIHSTFYDPTCVMRAQDHTFLTSDSYLDYKFARIMSANQIDASIQAEEFKLCEAIPSDLLEQARAGILASPHTRKSVKEWYQQARFDDLL